MRRRFPAILGVLAVLAAGGCGSRGPHIARLPSDAVILAFGDSLTAGTGAEPRESYPAVLAESTGYKVVNAGVPGETSAEGLARLPSALEQNKPQLVVLCHGGNDLLQRLDERQIAANLEAMIELARASGANVILVAVPRPRLLLKPAPFYREVAAQCRVPCDEETLPDVLGHPGMKSHQIHPNAQGYRKLAKALAELIRRSQSS